MRARDEHRSRPKAMAPAGVACLSGDREFGGIVAELLNET
jgi:hypothetical protein